MSTVKVHPIHVIESSEAPINVPQQEGIPDLELVHAIQKRDVREIGDSDPNEDITQTQPTQPDLDGRKLMTKCTKSILPLHSEWPFCCHGLWKLCLFDSNSQCFGKSYLLV